jgi:alpha-2-macroglobulin
MRSFAAPRTDLDVRKLAALEALSRHGRAQPRMLGSITLAPAAWPTSALLDWWAVLRRVEGIQDRAARLNEVQRVLRSRLILGGGSLRFSTEDSDDWWWLMDSADGNAARLLLAASEVPGWKDDAPLLATGLLGRQQRGAWATTTANLWGVLALEKFTQRFESVAVGGRSSLQLGQPQRTIDWAQAPAGMSSMLPWPVNPSPLTASHSGPGHPWLAVQTLAAVPLQAPLAAGYRITRTLAAVQRQRPEAWTRGDVLRVRIEVEAATDMTWVVVSDPLPAGAALLGGGLGRDSAMAIRGERREGSGWLAYEERAQDAWRAYFEWLPRGRHVVEYTLRLNTGGSFGLPPTRVEAMYAPGMFGERPNLPLEVRP